MRVCVQVLVSVCVRAVKKTNSQNIWPRINSNQLNELKPREARIQKTARNCENVTLVARQREHFRSFRANFLVAQLPPKEVFLYARIQSLLVNGVITASSHAL